MPIVEVDGKEIEFPDDMPDEAILEVLRAQFPPTEQPQAIAPAVEPSLANDQQFSGMEMLSNIPRSAGELATNAWDAITSPVEAAKGVGQLGAGALAKGNELLTEYMPEQLAFMGEPLTGGNNVFGSEYAPIAEDAAAALVERYGGVDEALNTLEQDPVGALADVAGVAMGSGATSVGRALNPIAAARNVPKLGVAKLAGNRPAGMYENVAKFSTTLQGEDRARMVRTALDKGVMPTEAGMGVLRDRMDVIDQDVSRLIDRSATSGDTVRSGRMFSELRDLRERKGGPFIEAESDLAAINKFAGQQARSIRESGKQNLTAADAQAIKRDLYGKTKWDRSRMTGSQIKDETYEALGRGAKNVVEELVPEVGPLNREWGSLLELQPHLQRSANRIDNRDAVSLSSMMGTVGGGTIGGLPGAVAGGALGVAKSPKIVAKTAIVVDQMQKRGYGVLADNAYYANDAALSAALAGNAMGANEEELEGILSGR